ncbi:hypothetical protein HUJ05_011648 [Dendroctonus ponderosae]|nr:hypothetical protein HUJ05_011648 [Dendroctonus ponderosae]
MLGFLVLCAAAFSVTTAAVDIGHGFWTAGSSLGSAFAWFTTGSALSYKNFPPGQPDNPNTEKCVELFRLANGTWRWNNYVCNAELPAAKEQNIFCTYCFQFTSTYDSAMAKKKGIQIESK